MRRVGVRAVAYAGVLRTVLVIVFGVWVSFPAPRSLRRVQLMVQAFAEHVDVRGGNSRQRRLTERKFL